jgi:hypothetical protein
LMTPCESGPDEALDKREGRLAVQGRGPLTGVQLPGGEPQTPPPVIDLSQQGRFARLSTVAANRREGDRGTLLGG